MKKILALGLMWILSISVLANTEFSKFIEYVQTKYADKFTDYPILIFDLDEVEYRYAKAGVYGDSFELEKKRAAIIQEYVKEKVGMDLTLQEALSYELYTTKLKEGAFALPTLIDGPNYTKVYKMCAVFPAAPNSNQRLETERITGLTTPGAYENVTYEGLQQKLTYAQMQAFSLYHELGHCMDRLFMPKNYNTYEVSAHDVHVGESYAEVFALMMLEREGITGTGQTRALLRNLYTQEMGKWFIDNPQNGFGNPAYLKGGIVYYLAPSLLAANEFVRNGRNRDFLQGPIDALLLKAKEIVDEHALDGRSFHGIYRAMSEETDEVLKMYREFAVDSPSFFRTAYRDILRFLDFSPHLYSLIVGDEPNDDSGIEVNPSDFIDGCTLESESDVLGFLQEKRDLLERGGLDYSSQTKLRDYLNSFYEDYSKCFPVKN